MLEAALEACRRDPGAALSQEQGVAAADVITADMRGIVERADEVGIATCTATLLSHEAGG